MAKPLRVPVTELQPGFHSLSTEASRYVVRVHRRRVGDELLLFDAEQGTEALATLTSIRESKAHCEVGELCAGSRPGYRGLSLCVGLAKADKPERVIRDTVALGVGRLVLVSTERSVARVPSEERAASKLLRWRAIALEAARQSLRSDIPELVLQASIQGAFDAAAGGTHLVLDPDAVTSLGDCLVRERPDLAAALGLTLWVGPEGGFSEVEVDWLESQGARRVHFAPFVLRTEVAATATIGAVVSFAITTRPDRVC